MQIDDSHLDRSADLVAKVRKLREQAKKEMNRFTRVEDYYARRVVGQKPKDAPPFVEQESTAPPGSAKKKRAPKSSSDQTTIEFSPAPPELGEEEEDL